MRKLYDPIEPYNEFMLQVSKLHTIHVQECGNPKGRPILFLHGGPGGGIESIYRQYFNPKKWRVILFDQRGCGKSIPHAEIKNNSTWDLVSDIEKIRNKLNIDLWSVFGGSWGSTLSLSYAIKHPNRCEALVLRGIFMLRKKEISWFYQEGASYIFPDEWEKYIDPIPSNERNNFVKAYYKRLTSNNKNIRIQAARAWSMWEAKTSKLFHNDGDDDTHSFDKDYVAEAFARIECHYFINNGFFETDSWILDNIYTIQNIPTYIVQGRYDIVCPLVSAWELKNKFKNSHFYIIKDAGHSMLEEGICNKLIEITDSI
tara:strand:- start:838 stop:1782 length:945 start_codon:yes stop_codon:yes gene_type:complete